MIKNIDSWTIIGILVSIGLVIITPSIPKLTYTEMFIIIITLFLAILIVLIVNEYLKIKDRLDINEEYMEKINKDEGMMRKEIEFLKERFKTLEDLSELRTRLELLEMRYKK